MNSGVHFTFNKSFNLLPQDVVNRKSHIRSLWQIVADGCRRIERVRIVLGELECLRRRLRFAYRRDVARVFLDERDHVARADLGITSRYQCPVVIKKSVLNVRRDPIVRAVHGVVPFFRPKRVAGIRIQNGDLSGLAFRLGFNGIGGAHYRYEMQWR